MYSIYTDIYTDTYRYIYIYNCTILGGLSEKVECKLIKDG